MADYHSLLMRAIANLPNAGTSATRGAIYERARKALLDQLRSLRPPLPESDISREENALDAAIAEIEERYGSQEPAPPPSSTPPPPVAAKPEATPAKAAPPPPPPKFATVQRPTAPPAPGPAAATARSPSQTGVPGQPGAANAAVPGAAQR
ncbi:MAG: histidine kinase, partial [Roseiarcus sp.]